MFSWVQVKSRLAAHPLARVGPGLITGVADDDPSGIATYSQAGAQSGSTCYGRCLLPSR
jgi:Mn2+/Fe2+ NRAMP family transporter